MTLPTWVGNQTEGASPFSPGAAGEPGVQGPPGVPGSVGPKGKSGARTEPRFATSRTRMAPRGPGTGIPAALSYCPRPVQGPWAQRVSPHKGVPAGQDWGCIFGFMDIWDHVSISLQWPCYVVLSRWMGQEVHSQTSSSPDSHPEALVQKQHVWTTQGKWGLLSLTPIWPTLLPAAAGPGCFTLTSKKQGSLNPTSCSCLPKANFALGSSSDPLTRGQREVSPTPALHCGAGCPGLRLAPDGGCLVLLLRFQWFSWPTGSPRSVCCLYKWKYISGEKKGMPKGKTFLKQEVVIK